MVHWYHFDDHLTLIFHIKIDAPRVAPSGPKLLTLREAKALWRKQRGRLKQVDFLCSAFIGSLGEFFRCYWWLKL
jgi:hypothetical protein